MQELPSCLSGLPCFFALLSGREWGADFSSFFVSFFPLFSHSISISLIPRTLARRRYAYIPLLPVAIQGLVSDAPMPLLVGMHTANVEQGIYAQDEAVVVDVDRDTIRSVAHARAVTPLPQLREISL